MTVAETARVRRKYVKNLDSAMIRFDRAQERLEKAIKSLLRRKRSVPEPGDLAKLSGMMGEIVGGLQDFSALLQKGFPA